MAALTPGLTRTLPQRPRYNDVHLTVSVFDSRFEVSGSDRARMVELTPPRSRWPRRCRWHADAHISGRRRRHVVDAVAGHGHADGSLLVSEGVSFLLPLSLDRSVRSKTQEPSGSRREFALRSNPAQVLASRSGLLMGRSTKTHARIADVGSLGDLNCESHPPVPTGCLSQRLGP